MQVKNDYLSRVSEIENDIALQLCCLEIRRVLLFHLIFYLAELFDFVGE